MMNKKDVKLFFKSVFITSACICCLTSAYLGFCTAYEEMRSTCFGDDRSAVVLGDGYIKFFDMEYFF